MLPEERASATQAHQLAADITGLTKQARAALPRPYQADTPCRCPHRLRPALAVPLSFQATDALAE